MREKCKSLHFSTIFQLPLPAYEKQMIPRVGAFYGAYGGALAGVFASRDVIRLASEGFIEADLFDVSIN